MIRARDPLADIDVLDAKLGKKKKIVQIQEGSKPRSFNITEEALAIGKVPPEEIS